MAQNEITLKVAEALSQRDIGQGIARLDPKTMSDLGINERDLIEITGDKKNSSNCPTFTNRHWSWSDKN